MLYYPPAQYFFLDQKFSTKSPSVHVGGHWGIIFYPIITNSNESILETEYTYFIIFLFTIYLIYLHVARAGFSMLLPGL